MPKSGGDHLASLRDGRSIYIEGARVEDPTSCRAFRNVTSSVKRLYDFANSPANRDLMTFETETGRRANRIWQLSGLLRRPHRKAQGARSLDCPACRISGSCRGAHDLRTLGADFCGRLVTPLRRDRAS